MTSHEMSSVAKEVLQHERKILFKVRCSCGWEGQTRIEWDANEDLALERLTARHEEHTKMASHSRYGEDRQLADHEMDLIQEATYSGERIFLARCDCGWVSGAVDSEADVMLAHNNHLAVVDAARNLVTAEVTGAFLAAPRPGPIDQNKPETFRAPLEAAAAVILANAIANVQGAYQEAFKRFERDASDKKAFARMDTLAAVLSALQSGEPIDLWPGEG